jgi:hypothetical protein
MRKPRSPNAGPKNSAAVEMARLRWKNKRSHLIYSEQRRKWWSKVDPQTRVKIMLRVRSFRKDKQPAREYGHLPGLDD